jgi:hypothetical protein
VGTTEKIKEIQDPDVISGRSIIAVVHFSVPALYLISAFKNNIIPAAENYEVVPFFVDSFRG